MQGVFDLAQITFHLRREISFAFPSFAGAKIKKINGVIVAGLLDGYFIINYVQIEYEYSARALFFPKEGHEIITIYYQNYERRNPR